MAQFQLDRQKYLRIAESQGVNAALTALHRDTELMEFDTFEGTDGYQPSKFEYLKQVREFSRELWGLALAKGTGAAPTKSGT